MVEWNRWADATFPAFLGGALTIISPCILPVLPFMFARPGRSFARSTTSAVCCFPRRWAPGAGPILGLILTGAAINGPSAHTTELRFDSTHAISLLVVGPGPEGKPVRFRVTLDGRAPADSHGVDINSNGEGVVREQRLYQLIRQIGQVADNAFMIEFLDPGAQAWSFTFG
jgi:hypothetical protein